MHADVSVLWKNVSIVFDLTQDRSAVIVFLSVQFDGKRYDWCPLDIVAPNTATLRSVHGVGVVFAASLSLSHLAFSEHTHKLIVSRHANPTKFCCTGNKGSRKAARNLERAFEFKRVPHDRR